MERPRRDDGFTLVEVLMAMIVLGIGVAALMTAMGTHIATSVANRNQTQAESLLGAAAEYVKALPWQPTSSPCSAITGGTLAATGPVPHDALFKVTYSDGQALMDTSVSPPVQKAGMCALQVITVSVDQQLNGADDPNGYHLQVSVLKRPAANPS